LAVLAYCDPSDVYDYGLPRGSVPRNGRLAYAVDTSADTIELDGHGFADGDVITFRAEAGGALPTPLAAGTPYYVIVVNDYLFQISATEGGAAVNLSTAGESVVVIPPDPVPAACDWGARIIDDQMPAHAVPLTAPYPEIVVMTNAELAAWKLLAKAGAATISLSEMTKEVRARLARWAAGVPIRGTNEPTATSQAASAAVPRTTGSWSRYGGIR
jgi:hypothetical protein